MASTKTILSRILFILYLIAICFLCFATFGNIPGMSKTILGIPSDKIAHFLMFSPFPILSYLSFEHPAKKPWKSVAFIFLSLIAGCAVAGGTEYIQGFLPHRSMDITDFYSDAIALTVFSVFVLIVDLCKHQK